MPISQAELRNEGGAYGGGGTVVSRFRADARRLGVTAPITSLLRDWCAKRREEGKQERRNTRSASMDKHEQAHAHTKYTRIHTFPTFLCQLLIRVCPR
jgi:hypothetical protein